jgi:4-hydroxy-3-polyprenylbenzoate decarboxylase
MTDDITLAITGASGSPYAIRLLEQLLATGKQVNLLISKPGQIVMSMESELSLSAKTSTMQQQLASRFQLTNAEQLRVFGLEQWTAPVASGSGISRAMVVCPCTTGTLSSIATGQCRNLIDRAADVTIKEQKKLIMVIRETPLSAIHLDHMHTLAQLGVVIMPASPGFYNGIKTVNDLVDFMVARILDHLDIPNDLTPRWGIDTLNQE